MSGIEDDSLVDRNIVAGRRVPAWVCYAALAALSVLISAGTVWIGGLPEPVVHDEYSNLLAADTFAHGRLTNPIHPMWKYLQTFYVLQRPSRQSKYPPGQGLILAMGRVLVDEPIAGVWVMTALLVVAAAWMLEGTVGRRWAIAGAAVLAVHPQIVEWSKIYWGGTAAALGGILVLRGACGAGRSPATSEPGWRPWVDGAAIGLGLGILLNTRPYEGSAMALPALVAVAWRLRGNVNRAAVLAPLLVTFTPIAIWTGYYNHRVTGSALNMPYLEYERQYAAAPPLLLQSSRPIPQEIPAEMREYAETVELPHFQQQRSVVGFLSSAVEKLRELLGDTAGLKSSGRAIRVVGNLLFLLPPLLAYFVWRDPRLRLSAAIVVCVVVATLASNWTRSQYAAPAVGAVLELLIVSVRAVSMKSQAAGRGILAVAGIAFAVISFTSPNAYDESGRSKFAASLAAEPGRQLVLVNYLPDHRLDNEWIENEADIDRAQTVWARDPGSGPDADLLRYFDHRTVWRLTVGRNQVSIQRFSTTVPDKAVARPDQSGPPV